MKAFKSIIMKNHFLIISMSILCVVSCDFEHFEIIDEPKQSIIFSAIMEQPDFTRSIANDKTGEFKWTQGDNIYLISNEGTEYSTDEAPLVVKDGVGYFDIGEKSPICAVYPDIFPEDGGLKNGIPTKISLPCEYGDFETPYTASLNTPMYAVFNDSNGSNVNFKHLAGVLSLTIDQVPAGTNQFVFEASSSISGDFSIYTDTDGSPIIKTKTASDSNNSYTIKFKATEEESRMTFYVPLPLGTYRSFKASLITSDGSKYSKSANNSKNSILRRTLAVLNADNFEIVNYELVEKRLNDYVVSETLYTVYTAEGLQEVNQIINNLRKSVMPNIILAKDIELPIPNEGESNWNPLCPNYIYPYTGTFDGNGKTISGLTINMDGVDDVGLIANLDGDVKNLTLKDCNIIGGWNVGGISGAIDNFSTITNCSVEGFVSGKNNVGGIVGKEETASSSEVTYCSVSGNITGKENVGGIAGNSSGLGHCSVKDLVVTGVEYVGGIVGTTKGCSYSMVKGNVTVNSDGYAGGIAGNNYGMSYCDIEGVLTIDAGGNAGGIAGWNAGTLKGCDVSGIVTIQSSEGNCGGIAGRNNGSYNSGEILGCSVRGDVCVNAGDGYSGGIVGWNDNNIYTCFANGVNLKGEHCGGIVGYQSGATGCEILSCYAYYCNTQDSNIPLTDNQNIYSSYSTDPYLPKSCYYVPYNSESLKDLSGNTVEWGDMISGVVKAMNDEIMNYVNNSLSSVVVYYLWSGTKENPILTEYRYSEID